MALEHLVKKKKKMHTHRDPKLFCFWVLAFGRALYRQRRELLGRVFLVLSFSKRPYMLHRFLVVIGCLQPNAAKELVCFSG